MTKRKNSKGMTLIELLVAIAISGILGVGLVSLQYILSQNQVAITTSYKSVDDANYISSSFAKEIRGARQSDNGAYYLSIAGDNEIVFYSDIDLDGDTEWVRYVLDENSLTKEIIEPAGYPAIYDLLSKKTSLLSDKVENNDLPVFYYYNSDWPDDTVNNPLPAEDRLSETSTIKIYLIINNSENAQKSYTVESSAQVRSAKDNL